MLKLEDFVNLGIFTNKDITLLELNLSLDLTKNSKENKDLIKMFIFLLEENNIELNNSIKDIYPTIIYLVKTKAIESNRTLIVNTILDILEEYKEEYSIKNLEIITKYINSLID